MKRRILVALLPLLASGAVVARAPYPQDPLHSPMWTAHAAAIFGDDPVRFDSRIRLEYPAIAENQRSFPVVLDARGVAGVRRMVIFADLNPIPVAIDYRPRVSAAYIATRIKLDQRTPVRGAVQLADGQWLVSGGWIDAAGGGCSAPPLSRVRGDWAEHLGELRGEAWATGEAGTSRLRLMVRHPMDTGLVGNIPTYNIETVTITSATGALLGELELSAANSEDPALTVMPHAAPGETLTIAARDTNGRIYPASVVVPGMRAP